MDYSAEVQEALVESDDVDCPRCGSVEDLVRGKNPAKLYCAHCGVARALVKVQPAGDNSVRVNVVILKVTSSKKAKRENSPIGFGRCFMLGMLVTIGTSGIFYAAGKLLSENPSPDFGLVIAWMVMGTILSLVAGMVAAMENSSAW